jgi:hypothetical protein
MGVVSNRGQDQLSKIIEWELVGSDAPIDPHRIMRDLSDSDLESAWDNLQGAPPDTKKFVSYQVVELEKIYRQGLMHGDWNCIQEGSRVRLSYSPNNQTTAWAKSGPQRMTA